MIETLVATTLGLVCLDPSRIAAYREYERRNSGDMYLVALEKGCKPLTPGTTVAVVYRGKNDQGEDILQVDYEDSMMWTAAAFFTPKARTPSPKFKPMRDPLAERVEANRKRQDREDPHWREKFRSIPGNGM